MSKANPINYVVHLEPDLRNFSFQGTTRILFEADGPVDKISLNILDLAVWRCEFEVKGGSEVCPFHVNPVEEEITVFLPKKISGEITLNISYTGVINDRMAGFYRSMYMDEGTAEYVAVTQFEESDARRAFPCLDRPAKKATFDIEMIVDESMTAISNCPVSEERALENGKKLVIFKRTPIMSTYLLFFGMGKFEFIGNKEDPRIRAATMPKRANYAKMGLDLGRKSLEFCESEFETPYPLPKLDLIAVPDFAFGAMENWGAITFRENLLLYYPEITSRSGEERMFEVIAHEIVHQWFGNLVTPSDWKYLWLNESFATYFGYAVVNHFCPDWDMWGRFLHVQTDAALSRDALHRTFPIEIPGGEHVVINSSTAPIIYNKGGSVLRQVKGYIGGDEFREGLRYYIKRHQYACASSHHLWEALEEVSGKPVIRLMKSWIEQPGFPMVAARREGEKLVLSQKRFTYLPNSSDQTWVIPLTVRVFYEKGGSRCITTLLEEKETRLEIGEGVAAYKVNHGQTGFYRVQYLDGQNLNGLGERVRTKELSPIDRWGIQTDLYALAKAGDVFLHDYLKFLSNYTDEDSSLTLVSITENLFDAYRVMEGPKRAGIASVGKSIIERALGNIGYDPEPEESHASALLRDQIIPYGVWFGSQDAKEFALERFSSLLNGNSVHSDIVKSVMQVGAMYGDSRTVDWFLERFDSSLSEHERMNILTAFGSFRDTAMIERVQRFILEKVPARNKFVPAVAMSGNPAAAPYMWDWYRANLTAVERFHPLHYERVVAGLVPVSGLGREAEVKAFFEDYLAKKDTARDSISLSLERLEINSRLRNS